MVIAIGLREKLSLKCGFETINRKNHRGNVRMKNINREFTQNVYNTYGQNWYFIIGNNSFNEFSIRGTVVFQLKYGNYPHEIICSPLIKSYGS